MKIETMAVHAGRHPDPATGAVTPPIHMATTFEREEDGSYPRGFIYGRSGNPNRSMLEECLAKLEGGSECAAFASGMAALTAVCQSLAPGDHVVAPSDIYQGTARMLREIMAPWGLKVSFIDMTEVERVKKAMTPKTRLVLVETPSNPLLKVVDIKGCAEAAHSVGAVCAVDNTWVTPVLQQPLELGADLAVHSSTKYLGGHGDVTGGAVVARDSEGIFKKVRHIQQNGGAVPSPFDCWLIMRGIRTLPYRMRAHCENASRVAEFLASHSMVTAVHYPGLASHTGHRLAKAQMSGFGGMLSFQVKGGREAAFGVASRTRLFTRATSLGSYESLIEHRASVEGPESRTPEDLLRVSVGLEHPEDLVEDLGRAMEG